MERKTRLTLWLLALGVIIIAGTWLWLEIWPQPKREALLVVLPTADNPFWVDVKLGAEDAASGLSNEFTVFVRAGEADAGAEAQKEILHAFIEEGHIAAVVLGPASSSAVIPEVRAYRDKGVPVVVIDSKLDEEDLASSFLGSDNEAGGRLAGQEMSRLLAENATVLLIGGSPEHQTARARAQGFRISAKTSWNIIEESGNWDRTLAREIIESQLARGVPQGIFAASDEMALGAIAGLHNAGVSAEAWPIIIGFDATQEGLDAITQGRMWATIKQNAFEMGQLGVRLAAAHARGDVGIPKRKLLDVELIRR